MSYAIFKNMNTSRSLKLIKAVFSDLKANSINYQKFILFFSNLSKNFKLNKTTTQFFFSLKQYAINFFNQNRSDVYGN